MLPHRFYGCLADRLNYADIESDTNENKTDDIDENVEKVQHLEERLSKERIWEHEIKTR